MAYIKKVNSLDGQTTYDIKAMAVEEGAAVQNTSGNMTSGAAVRNISYGSNNPTGGNNGDIYLQSGTTTTIIDLIYPVGSIYMSLASSADPATLFPGTTWSRIEGRFLLGYGGNYTSLGNTGGESAHTLTVNEMPAHGHSVHIDYNDNNTTNRSVVGWYGTTNPGGSVGVKTSPNYYAQNSRITIEDTGGGAEHNNMPPYVIVHMWHRTN